MVAIGLILIPLLVLVVVMGLSSSAGGGLVLLPLVVVVLVMGPFSSSGGDGSFCCC